MPGHKELLREKFSSQPDKYYRVELFSRLGFVRKQCTNCHAFFWTLDTSRTVCPDPTCQNYEFLGNPTPERMDYVETWKKVSDFYARNGHHIVKRYPVVCRWRPDIYFTIASIVDFQRVESGKVVFEFPSNPLVVPQMCLRFVDIGNVGITGRHYTSFCMIGQQALANAEGYWKDKCIELVFDVLNRVLLVPKEEIVFREDVWVGPGAFGYCLDYYVRGLEMGNAVFTQFEGTPDHYVEYREPVVDMGAGLERWAWLTNGTPTSYEVVFQRPLEKLKGRIGSLLSEEDRRNILEYYKLAGGIDVEQFKGKSTISDEFMSKIGVPDQSALRLKLSQLQAIYSILDHTRTLLFAISDGALPSNVGGGYNLRVILRRALDFARQLDFDLDLAEVAEWHAEQLEPMYPELSEHTEDCRTIFAVESQKYDVTKERSKKIVESLSKSRVTIDTDKMIELYESEGITPESLVSAGLEATVPPDFYLRVTEKHEVQKKEETQKQTYDVSGLPPTKLLFYEKRDTFEFQSKVLRVLDGRYVILERTGFYPRGGGQEPDHGKIEGVEVVDVTKSKNVAVHEMDSKQAGSRIEEGRVVNCIVDSRRRNLIMRHHTATHIVNGAARRVIGPWVWQHSAFKDENMARLDITHFAHLTRDQVLAIERAANEVVRENPPVNVSWLPRNEAEQKYGFRIYQGGVVPSKELRIVDIRGWDVEACGGTHCSSTGEIGLVKITKTERIQDGVERIEFVAGAAALDYVQTQEGVLLDSAAALQTPPGKVSATIVNLKESEGTARKAVRYLSKTLAEVTAKDIPKKSIVAPGSLLLYVSLPEGAQEELGQEYYTMVGERVSSEEPRIVYVAIFTEGERSRIMIFAGEGARDSGVNAGLLVREISKRFGGSGGGDTRFGQGGMPRPNIPEEEQARAQILEILKSSISKNV